MTVESARAELELVRGHHRPDICFEQGCYACRAYWAAMEIDDAVGQAARDYLDCTAEPMYVHTLRGKDCEGGCRLALQNTQVSEQG